MALRARLMVIARLGVPVYLRHVYQKAAGLTIGAFFVSPLGRKLRSRLANFRAASHHPSVRAAVVAHLFYLDLLPEILSCRAQLPEDAVLHLTVPEDRVEQARLLLATVPLVVIHPCENRGRDIAPFIALLNAGTFEAYDAVLKLHTKRSTHLMDGEIRRKLLFDMLAGDRYSTSRILAAFENKDTGMLGWGASYRTASPYWMSNESRVREIGKRMGVPDELLRLGFFEGSMFWFRPSALDRLRRLGLLTDDFEAEAGQLDGTLHHAIERCFTIAARADGFKVRDLHGRILT